MAASMTDSSGTHNNTNAGHVVLKRSFAPIVHGPWHDEPFPSFINHKLHPFPPMWAQ